MALPCHPHPAADAFAVVNRFKSRLKRQSYDDGTKVPLEPLLPISTIAVGSCSRQVGGVTCRAIYRFETAGRPPTPTDSADVLTR